MEEIRAFGTELSGYHVRNGGLSLEARSFMYGAAATRITHEDFTSEFRTKRRQTVTELIRRAKTTKTTRAANRRRENYKTTGFLIVSSLLIFSFTLTKLNIAHRHYYGIWVNR